MWFLMALSSALMLGFYDVLKKQSLRANAVIPVLFLNTLFSTLIFLPLILGGACNAFDPASHWFVPLGTIAMHRLVVVKAVIVLASWVCGYFAIKHLPLTIVGPINATRPVMTLVGALLIFGEHLNPWQWAGVLVAIIAFFLLSRTGKKEGLNFARDRWVILLILAAILGAVSGLYDKYLLAPVESGGRGLPALFVQSWFCVYQMLMMSLPLLLWQRRRAADERFEWRWTIVGISLFLCAADACYFYALSLPGALIAVVSMVRRSSVLVSFLFGAFVLRERNVKTKAADLLLVLLSLLLLCLGAR